MITGNELKIIENLECPEEFQQIVMEVGGLNPYGQPNFKIVWCQSETMWQGGYWKVNDDLNENYFIGYREVLLGDGLPYWLLLQWVDSGKCLEMPFLEAESPEDWYNNNLDPETGLSILGEYPYEGSYQVVMPLVHKWFRDGKLCIEPIELTSDIIDIILPVIEQSKEVGIKEMMNEMKEEEIKKEKDKQTLFEDMYRDIRINPNLHAAWLEEKQREIEKSKTQKLLPNNGFFQMDRPL